MFKVIMIIAFLFATATALTFVCACVVGSRYEKRADEAQSSSNQGTYLDE